jgi:dienelactone hydrolase
MNDPLDDFTESTFTHGKRTRPVYRAGSGPAVLVIHEAPGITPEVAGFARRLVDHGFDVWMPSLFGTPGRAVSNGYMMRSMGKAVVSPDFAPFARSATSPITEWLRGLARAAHTEDAGPGVGVVGMCFTGNLPLGMLTEDVVIAPVCSQPSLPFAIGQRRAAAPGVSAADLGTIRARVANGARVIGLRFTADPFCSAQRFETLRRELGDGFEGIEIDSSPGNAHDIPKGAHSVLTNDLVDEPGHPTRVALDRVLAFLDETLKPG